MVTEDEALTFLKGNGLVERPHGVLEQTAEASSDIPRRAESVRRCDTRTCASVIWSGATQGLPGAVGYLSAMRSIGHAVDFPEACPGTPSSPRPTTGRAQ